MKHTYLFLTACLVYLLTACTPDFRLDAPYKDITIVYGVLDYSLDTNYVKVYKGFQGGSGFALEPDSIYYKKITVVLEDTITKKTISMYPTHDFRGGAEQTFL